MSPSFPLHGCQQQSHGELRRASLPALVPRVELQSQGYLCSLTALEWLGRSSKVSSELGPGGCSIGGPAVGTGRNWHCSPFSCFWNSTCASGCQSECRVCTHWGCQSRGSSAKLSKLVCSMGLSLGQSWSRVEGGQYPSSNRNVTLLPHLRFLLHNRECL